jgi:hypothetical protein
MRQALLFLHLLVQVAQLSSAAFELFIREEETSKNVTEHNRVALLKSEHDEAKPTVT